MSTSKPRIFGVFPETPNPRRGPAFLEYDDGTRQTFTNAARLMRESFPIRDANSTQTAISRLTRDVIPGIVEYRDGQITVPLKVCHWLCMAAMEIETCNALPSDYGSKALKDLAVAMEIPIKELGL